MLSESVGKILQTYGGPDVQELAKLVLLMDQFFDIMNIRCHGEAQRTLKAVRQPFTSLDDSRFKVNK